MKMEHALKEQKQVYAQSLKETERKVKLLKESAWHSDTVYKYLQELNTELRALI